jgi:hypothetical protein
MTTPTLEPPSTGRLGLILIAGWLVPGAGFLMCGRWARGLAHLGIIGLTFALGLALEGAVLWPAWSFQSEEFNLINNFTFITQLGAGLPAIASFLATRLGESPGGPMGWLAGEQSHTNFELGTYYLIVAGALNYFAVGNLYDRLTHPGGEEHDAEPAEETQS